MPRCFTKIYKVRFGKLLFLARDLRRGQFSVDHKRNENGFAVFSRHTFSAEGDVFDFKIDRAHVINTLLQQSVKREQNSFATDRALRATALKRGVNEKLQDCLL